MRVAFADPALRLGGLLAALLIGTATHAAGIAALPVVAPVQSCEALAQTDLTIDQLMLTGEVAAAILGVDMPKDPRVRTLVPDPHVAAGKWYRREGVIPINHMFVVHEDIARSRPDVVRELFRMIVESRAAAPAAAAASIPPLGLEANRKGLKMAIGWSFEQKIIPRRLSVDELFDETTAQLAA